LLKREELTAEHIDQIVADARKAGYDFFLSAEEREASLKEALTRYQPGEEAWVFAYGSLMWNPALEFAEAQPCKVDGWRRSFCFWVPLGRGTSPDEVARLVLALLALPSVTGQMVAPDGGQHLQWWPRQPGSTLEE